MFIDISAQHIELGTAFQEHVNTKIMQISQKYFPNTQEISVEVHCSAERHKYQTHNQLHCKIIYRKKASDYALIVSEGRAESNIYEAFACARRRLKAQLEKYSHKIITNLHTTPKLAEVDKAIEYIIDTQEEVEEVIVENNNTVIIESKPVEILNLNLNDAVMKLQLEHLPVLMFINTESGRINTLYSRYDGTLVLIDSTSKLAHAV